MGANLISDKLRNQQHLYFHTYLKISIAPKTNLVCYIFKVFLPSSGHRVQKHKNLLTKVKYFFAGFLNYLTNLFLGMTKRLALCSSLYELADFMFY